MGAEVTGRTPPRIPRLPTVPAPCTCRRKQLFAFSIASSSCRFFSRGGRCHGGDRRGRGFSLLNFSIPQLLNSCNATAPFAPALPPNPSSSAWLSPSPPARRTSADPPCPLDTPADESPAHIHMAR